MEVQHLCGCHAEEGLHLALPLPHSFSLQMAVCTYGFFMTAPNSWFPHAHHLGGGLLERPLRLANGQAVLTRVFQTTSDGSISKLTACIRGVQQLSVADRDCILAQVTRMLRLSEMESSSLAAFHSIHPQAKAKGFGRLFRSPTLFEDMVKSLLLCNCGWGRTLTMVKALCELQAELKGPYLGAGDCLIETSKKVDNEVLAPQTPEGKYLKRKQNLKKMKRLKARKSLKTGAKVEGDNSHDFSNVEGTTEITSCQVQTDIDNQTYSSSQTRLSQTDQISVKCSTAEIVMLPNSSTTGSPCLGAFPIPEELAGLDMNFLAKRCSLGYRAKRILKLAKDICDETVDLKSFETVKTGQMHVEDIRSKLLQLQGFGPYTCANVLMCIGEYDTIAADTETVRHLKQEHGRSSCTVVNVSREAAEVYAVYAPFQFLAYWFELWTCYEKKFGQLSCMDPSNYDLFTGSNMRIKCRT